MAFASGKKAYGISDRSGFRYRLKDMRKEWNGLLVGKDEFEAKHPQLRTSSCRCRSTSIERSSTRNKFIGAKIFTVWI